MPAITLGLAEIEERLSVLRGRLNTVTLLHAASLSLSTACLVGAALIAVGIRGDVAQFRVVTWLGIALVGGVLAACGLAARRRWLDLAATAALVDQRGQLTDRLTTLLDLRARPRMSRLAPLLIAQTLALGERWHPQRIAPHRVPRSLFLVPLSLLVLTASPLVAPEPPPAAPPAQPAKNEVLTPGGWQDGAVPIGASLTGIGNPAEDTAANRGAPHPAVELQVPQTLPETASQGVPQPAEPAPETQLAMLPDRLRNAILGAFHAEQMDRGRQLGGAKGQSPEPAVAGVGDDRAGAKPNSDAAADVARRVREPGKPLEQGEGGAKAQPHPGDSQAGGQSQQAKNGSSDQNRDGSSPNAGNGSNPESLLGTRVIAAEPGHAGATTFKLTITSFLRGVEERGKQPRDSDKQAGSAGVATDSDEPPPPLNEQQLRDDAMRKAEIPPEYEDIVRRVYSLRADQ